MTNQAYLEASLELATALSQERIPFEISCLFGGCILYFPNRKNRVADVILHDGSYGNAACLFEGYGAIVPPDCYDDIYVFESIEEVVKNAKQIINPS